MKGKVQSSPFATFLQMLGAQRFLSFSGKSQAAQVGQSEYNPCHAE